ncbi:ferredoxin [Myroides sp. 1354]|uniref:ferredoxin n=1 Tax=unclassified Myroides TaxID=2642485 RepID=UPI002577C0F1|nr:MULTISPECIES: ferredoxin [unclassified Myroides]MDM1043586.1 ferredoxin [Myroides sp. R163-1]MDM1054364.1 ferredoxin [Myroides sp. 1354]MDM1067660.1 ferredoxin [Myroides sp. 1372]
MIVITLQRDKCIGCNYCVEVAPQHFQMSKKDGKTVLLRATNNKGFHTLKSPDYTILEACEQAEKVCPVHIINVKEV